MRKAPKQIWTVSSGTLRGEDLYKAFRFVVVALGGTSRLTSAGIPEYCDLKDLSQVPDLVGELHEILAEAAPEGWYFGTHWGDGAEFGFFPLEEEA